MKSNVMDHLPSNTPTSNTFGTSIPPVSSTRAVISASFNTSAFGKSALKTLIALSPSRYTFFVAVVAINSAAIYNLSFHP